MPPWALLALALFLAATGFKLLPNYEGSALMIDTESESE